MAATSLRTVGRGRRIDSRNSYYGRLVMIVRLGNRKPTGEELARMAFPGTILLPGENHLEVVEKKNHGYYRPASALEAGVSAGLDLILSKMLARQPRDRYQTASELIIDLEVYDLKHLSAIIAQLRAKAVVARVDRVNG